MEYVKRLLAHQAYREIQNDIVELEKDRIYCHHEFAHSTDVCRIAWILYLEDMLRGEKNIAGNPAGIAVEASQAIIKEKIYLSGLLHDVGRAQQYRTGEHHATVGRRIAEDLLADIECPEEWKEEILAIVELHFGRDQDKMPQGSIGDYICRADRLSRSCFYCKAIDFCKWTEEEFVRTIDV